MSKIGIVTLWGNHNYGNRLQNYAVERLIGSLGFEPRTIVIKDLNSRNHLLHSIKVRISEKIKNPQMAVRKKAFDVFNNTYIHPIDMIEQIECSALICGSDQIWNYTFPEFSSEMFLSFAKGRQTISLSASFGVSTIPDEKRTFYSEMIRSLDYISVREEQGAKLVKSLSGRDATVLVDPTMALGEKEWTRLVDGMERPLEPYVFTYFLGRHPNELNKRITNELGYKKVISFNNQAVPSYYAASPLDFVSMIAGSSAVITDSFHGAVFSIIFDKPFVVFDRSTMERSMSSRLDTLLRKFHLERNHISNIISFADCINGGSTAALIIKEEQKKAIDFLENALSGIEK